MSAQVSFVDVPIENHFPIQNLPFSAGFVRNSSNAVCVSRIGDFVIDLSVLEEEKFFISFIHRPVFHHSTLNDFMSLGRPVWQ